MRFVLYTDGAARGNPGPAAIGVVLADAHGREIAAEGQVISETTNNVAEYRALLYGLELAAHHGATDLDIRMDSLLLAEQLLGHYKVRAANLKPLFVQAQKALARFSKVEIRHIPRTLNYRADGLANAALDRSTSGRREE